MLSAIESSNEILPGYVLVDRLGSGGYAEVWRASAPGGLFKAIKIVHGFYDEELAAQELKAMERIKDVRHPFLLSLERFDVIEGRLVILTELADKSLDQRACECRAEGLPGIPREELLDYLEDAAEALDYLIEKKGLLHLDVKPENLLLLGEHLKVADFGLVKELSTRSQKSMIAGMTPTFAAPEMFDDHPSQRSDQYALAIVYQLMLTGTLPFPGRTAAQLAKQHTLSPPQLTSLSPADRDIVARGLAKDPDHRFPNCRALISALREAEKEKPRPKPAPPSPPVQATVPKGQSPSPADHETDRGSSEATLPRPGTPAAYVTQHLGKPAAASGATCPRSVTSPRPSSPAVLREERVVDHHSPTIAETVPPPPPTLTVAVGGVATRLLVGWLEGEAQLGESPGSPSAQLAIDTDRQELKKCCAAGDPSLSVDDALHLPLRLPKDYDAIRKQLDWLSRRWLYNIPRSLETRGYRPLGRLALVDHLDKVLRALEARMRQLLNSLTGDQAGDAPQPKLRVVLLAGMGGGTGGGMAIDMAYAIRHVAARVGAQVSVEGFLMGAPLASAAGSGLATANMFALLGELRQVSEEGNRGLLTAGAGDHPLEGSVAPFDAAYFVPYPSTSDPGQAHAVADQTASYLAWARRQPLSMWREACRATPTPQESGPDEPLRLRSLAFASLSQAIASRQAVEAEQLRHQVWDYWLAPGTPPLNRPSLPLPAAVETKDDSGLNDFTPSREERLRSRFQQRAATRFAEQVAEELAAIWPTPEDLPEGEDPRVIAGIKRLAGALELKVAQPLPDTALQGELGIPPQILARRVLHQLLAMPQWSTFDSPTCLQMIDELLQTECRKAIGSDTAGKNLDGLATEALQRATAGVLTCGVDRRTLAVLPNAPCFEKVAASLVATRPETKILRGEFPAGWVAVEGSGISAQSLALRMAHIHPDIADAADRLHTRTDIEWKNPLCES